MLLQQSDDFRYAILAIGHTARLDDLPRLCYAHVMKNFTFTFTIAGLWAALAAGALAEPIKVLVWDEQQPVRTKIYPNFPGNYIADFLKKHGGLALRSANINQPEQGLSSKALADADVLVWWGHVRHRDISAEKAREIVDRIKTGKLALISLHSSHWSVPFMVAMEEKAAQDALTKLPERDRAKAKVEFEGKRIWINAKDSDQRIELKTTYRRSADGGVVIQLERPSCVFPRCCTPKQPSQIRIIHPKHPICKGVQRPSPSRPPRCTTSPIKSRHPTRSSSTRPGPAASTSVRAACGIWAPEKSSTFVPAINNTPCIKSNLC